MARIRTFVAIDIPKPLRKKMQNIVRKLTPCTHSFKWVETENFHLTLNFLGDVEEQKLNNACRAVADVVAKFEPFQVDLVGVSAFPRRERPRAIYVAVDHGSEEIKRIYDEATLVLEDMGIQIDPRFQPHVTLGRLKKGRLAEADVINKILELEHADIGDFSVDTVNLYSSKLEKSGPVYVKIATCLLGE